MRICVPIIAKNKKEALTAIGKATVQGADILELRADFLKDMNASTLKTLIAAAKLPMIITIRIPEEGGQWQGTEKDRVKYLLQAAKYGADFIDIELAKADKEMISELKKTETKIILSHHDFKKTPPLKDLKSIHNQMLKMGADIGKVVTMIKLKKDRDTIYELIKGSPKNKIIAIGMGALGTETRVKGLEIGSYLTFASLTKAQASAPGQLTLKEMREIFPCRHFALIGGRGVGKSYIARELAKELKIPLYELDKVIEKQTGSKIPTIVERKGWSYFREQEYKALKKITAIKTPVVIDCGGGIICEQDEKGKQTFSTRKAKLLKDYCDVYWVQCDIEEQIRWLSQASHRPSLTPKQTIAEETHQTMKLRSPWYKKVADAIIRNELTPQSSHNTPRK